ncbi:unnamed protein product [Amaranthus hypochondriacus]
MASICGSHQILLRPQKATHSLIHGGFCSPPFISIKNSSSFLPIRCRFSQPQRRNSTYYRSRRAGMTNNLEAMTTTGAPTSVPVRVAHELLQAGHRYLDVRTPEEFSSGHVPGAVNIPYMFRLGSGMTKNPEFVEQVSSKFDKDDEILVGCQIGKRSLMAANDLHAAGFTGIVDVAGGYSAWTQTELPNEV